MKKIVILVCLLMAMALAGCGGTQEAGKKDLPPLKIGLMPDTDSLPFIVAKEKGYFDEEGVQVDLQPFKSAMDRDAAFQSGNLDGAVSDLLAAAFAKSGGFDVKVTSLTNGAYKLVAGKGETGADIHAYAGKDVAVSRNTIIEYVTDQLLTKAGMGENDIQKVVIPQIPTRLEMLQSGKLAAATLPEPMASIAIHNGCRYITGSDQLGINPGVVLFSVDAAKEKKAGIQAFYRAYNKAVNYLNTAPREESAALAIEKGGFPSEAREAMNLPKYQEATLPQEAEVTECMKWLNKKGLVAETYSYDDIVLNLLAQ